MNRTLFGGMGVGAMAMVMTFALLLMTAPSISAMAFTTDVRVDNGSSFSRDPVIGVNSTGAIHSVWADYRNLANNDIYAARSTNNGQSFVGDVRVDDSSGGNQMAPDIVVGTDDVVHVVWQDGRGTSDDIYYSNSTNAGTSFSSNKRIDDSTSGQQRNPAVAIRGLTVHVVWEDTRNGNYDIYYTKSTDNGDTWATNVRVDNTGSGSSDQRYPDIAVDGTGRILVVWQDNRNGNWDIYFASSTNGGTSFNTNIRVDDTGSGTSAQEQPAIDVDSDDNIHVAWQDLRNSDYDIYYCDSTNNGASFQSDTRVDDSTSGNQEFPALVVDVNDVVHAVWQDKRNSAAPDIYHTNTTGSGFDTNQRVDSSSSGNQELPDITSDGNANVFIVWEDDRGTDDDIYFSKNSNTQPNPPALTSPADDAWVNTSTPSFSWIFSDPDVSDSQTAFRLMVYSGPTTAYDTGTVVSSLGSHTASSAISDGSWSWAVRVRDSNGAWSYFSTPRTIKIDTTVPGANTPSGPGTWSTSSSVQWTWTPSTDSPSGIAGYHVCIGTTAGGCDVVNDGWTTMSQYTYNGGTDGTTYYAKVKAKDVAGNIGGYGGNSAGTTVDTQAPVANTPSDIGAWTKSTTITWTWTASTDTVSGVAGYYVCIGTASGATDIVNDAWTTSNSYTLHGAENGKSYFAKVRAKDNATNVGSYGTSSDGISVDTVAPTAGRPVDDGTYIPTTVVNFRWANSTDPISGIMGYYVSIGTLPGGNDVVADAFVTMANYTYATGQNGKTYYAIVKAVDNATNVGPASLSSDGVTVDLTKPTTPKVYTDALDDQDDEAKVWWDSSEDMESGVKGYLVELVQGQDLISSATTTLTSYTFSNTTPFLQHGQGYAFQVRALNGADALSDAGVGVFQVDTMVNDTTVPEHDGLYSDSTAIVWTWDAVIDEPAGILGYYVSIGTTPMGHDILLDVFTTTNGYTFIGGTNGATYYITARSVDRAGNLGGPVSNATGVTVDTTPPRVSAVTDEGPFSPDADLEFSWEGYADVGSGIHHYEIAIGTTPYGHDILVTTTLAKNFTFKGAETGRTYYAKVRAVDNAGNVGDWGMTSDGVSVDLSPPDDISLVDPKGFVNTTGSMYLEWTASDDPTSGISGYIFRIGTASGLGDVVDWTKVVTVKVKVEGLSLQNGNKYFISVRAVNGAGTYSKVLEIEVVVDTVSPTATSGVVNPDFMNMNALTWTWSEATDDRSGIGGYHVSIGSAPGMTDIVRMELVTGTSYTYGSGIHGRTYHATVISMDKAGNMGMPVMADPMTVDLVPPQVTMVLRKGEYSHERAVNWSWTGSDSISGMDGYWVTVMEEDSDPLDPVFVTEQRYVLSEGVVEGLTYFIQIQPLDRAGNLGDNAHGEGITIDTVAPSASVTINNNITFVGTRAVTVQISTGHRDIAQMMIGNVASLTGSNWEPFSPSRLWYLSAGDGGKDVYVIVRDFAGLQSPLYRTHVELDTVQPRLELDLPGDVVSSATLEVKGRAERDSEVLVNGKAVRVDDDGRFRTTVDLEEGTNLLTVSATDPAGNEVKVTRAINRESFGLPSSMVLPLILVLLLLTVIALAYAVSANRKMKLMQQTYGRGGARERGPSTPQAEREERAAPQPRSRTEAEKSRHEEERREEGPVLEKDGELSRPDIIATIQAKEDSDEAAIRAAEGTSSDEITLETEERGSPGASDEDGLDLEEDFDEEEVEMDEEEVEEVLEVDEGPTVEPVARVRCIQCKEIIPIYTDDRPLKIECPSCGKVGMIRK